MLHRNQVRKSRHLWRTRAHVLVGLTTAWRWWWPGSRGGNWGVVPYKKTQSTGIRVVWPAEMLAKLVLRVAVVSALVARSPTDAWYKQVAGPSYYSVGRASGLLSGIRRSPYVRRAELEATDGGESASNGVLTQSTPQNFMLKTMVSAPLSHPCVFCHRLSRAHGGGAAGACPGHPRAKTVRMELRQEVPLRTGAMRIFPHFGLIKF